MKYLPALFLILLLLPACSSKDENITFSAVIDSVDHNSILVSTDDDVGFEKARVVFAHGLELPFNLFVGQMVEIEALPEIRESYPVQIAAVNITVEPSHSAE